MIYFLNLCFFNCFVFNNLCFKYEAGELAEIFQWLGHVEVAETQNFMCTGSYTCFQKGGHLLRA
jgi:hypothetical protein